MRKRVHVAISMQPEDQARLKAMADKLGMKPSELVRGMLYKLEADEVTQSIILNEFLKENADNLGKDRLLRIMSIRSNLKKSGANSNHDAGSVSLSNQKNNKPYERINQSYKEWGGFDNAVRIAQARWVDGKDEKPDPELQRQIDEALATFRSRRNEKKETSNNQ